DAAVHAPFEKAHALPSSTLQSCNGGKRGPTRPDRSNDRGKRRRPGLDGGEQRKPRAHPPEERRSLETGRRARFGGDASVTMRLFCPSRRSLRPSRLRHGTRQRGRLRSPLHCLDPPGRTWVPYVAVGLHRCVSSPCLSPSAIGGTREAQPPVNPAEH